jgi:hypothetical protein
MCPESEFICILDDDASVPFDDEEFLSLVGQALRSAR